MSQGSANRIRGQDIVREFVQPHGLDEFFRSYWEKKHLYVPAAEPDRGKYDRFLPSDDLDRLLSRNDLRYPTIQLVKGGRSLPISDYARRLKIGAYSSDGLIDMDLVAARYREGATIVLQLLQNSVASAANLSACLAAFFRSRVDVHGFFTPRGSQGLTAHYDVGGAFLVQLRGAKKWRLFPMAVDTPAAGQTFDASKPIKGDPLDEIELKPGDVLYLPGGVPHEGLTLDSESLHLTLGLFTPTWREIMESTLLACEEDEAFRRAPSYLVSGTEDQGAFEADWEKLVQRFSEAPGTGVGDTLAHIITPETRRGRWL